ncbi:unnamed protein product [Protopolystoma xenopodis]|uniref:Uncharacterized protein n=1 Tax=Protopolystoma xenopodis TaxID=117903 RepID=A0A448X424_9PLAT|nr:unnamed protein product [Protopolystoma xenopodis]
MSLQPRPRSRSRSRSCARRLSPPVLCSLVPARVVYLIPCASQPTWASLHSRLLCLSCVTFALLCLFDRELPIEPQPRVASKTFVSPRHGTSLSTPNWTRIRVVLELHCSIDYWIGART